jgi:hypothetical protein
LSDWVGYPLQIPEFGEAPELMAGDGYRPAVLAAFAPGAHAPIGVAYLLSVPIEPVFFELVHQWNSARTTSMSTQPSSAPNQRKPQLNGL